MSVKAEPPRAWNHSGQDIPEVRQARWIGSGGGALGAKMSFIEDCRVVGVSERDEVVRRVL